MGADGHVDIYDYGQVLEQLGWEELPINGYGCYKQTLFGHKLLVVYYDNQHHDKCCPVCGDDGEMCEHWGIIKPALLDSWEVWT